MGRRNSAFLCTEEEGMKDGRKLSRLRTRWGLVFLGIWTLGKHEHVRTQASEG